MYIENKEITCKDGVTIAANLYKPYGASKKGAVVICPALGVPQKIYKSFSLFLSENGYAVVTFDYRGIGDSRNNIPNGKDIRMQDWGQLDIDAVLDYTINKAFGPIFLVGHSAGGQLSGMAPNSKQISGAIFTPSSSANWRLYPAPFCFGLYMIWHVLIPAISFGRDLFPAKMLGISSMDVPRGVMSQWAEWARQPDYFFSKTSGIDTGRYAELEIPILAYGFDDDSYASEKAIDHLLSQYSNSTIEKHYINSKDLGAGKIGHFGFFKEKMRASLWQQTLEWLENLSKE
jgi:predicted alpha/beta hydrolase